MIFFPSFLAVGFEVIFWVIIGFIYFLQFAIKKFAESQARKREQEETQSYRSFETTRPEDYPQSQRPSPPPPAFDQTPPPEASQDEELRKFLEALGLPTQEPKQTYSTPPPLPAPQEEPRSPFYQPEPEYIEPEYVEPRSWQSPVATPDPLPARNMPPRPLAPWGQKDRPSQTFGEKVDSYFGEVTLPKKSDSGEAPDAYKIKNYFSNITQSQAETATRKSNNNWRKFLTNKTRVRQAIVLREILGTPKGLEQS